VADAVPRSYCCQYRETDFAFVQRLLTEEGLCWRFEHDDEGVCCVLFSNSTQVCAVPEDASSAQNEGVRYHGVRPGESQDTVQAMHVTRSMLSTSVTVLSTDYKTRHAISATSHGRIGNGGALTEMEVFDSPGAYAYADPVQARRYADLHMETLEARSLLWQGRSTVRTLCAGTRLRITGMPMTRLGAAPAFTVTAVRSIGVNNLPPPSVNQDLQLAAGEAIAVTSGADTQFANGGQLRMHAQQAIGLLGGAVKAGEGDVGLQLMAAQDDIDVQAQAGTLTVQARDDVSVVSANAHIDCAAAKSISLSTAGRANITIEGGMTLCIWDEWGLQVGSDGTKNNGVKFLSLDFILTEDDRMIDKSTRRDRATNKISPSYLPEEVFPGYLELDGVAMDSTTKFS
jgi:hypothetical protein